MTTAPEAPTSISIFWKNTLAGGISAGPRYELDITTAPACADRSFTARSTISARNDRQRIEHDRSARSAFRCAVRSAGAPVQARRISAGEGSDGRADAKAPRVGAPRRCIRSLLLAHLDQRIDLDRRLNGLSSCRTATSRRCCRPPRPRRARSTADTGCATDIRSCRP